LTGNRFSFWRLLPNEIVVRLRIIAVVLALAGIGAAAAPAFAADGTGTMTVSPSTVIAGSTGNYLTFTYTADAAGLSGGSLALIVPSGWTTPSVSGGGAGGLGGSCGASNGYTVAAAPGGSEVQTTGVTLGPNQQCTIQYGVVGSGPGDTVPSAPGPSTFTADESSSAGGRLSPLSASPAVQITADGTGKMDVSPASAIAGSTGNTWAFKYTASTTVVSGELTIVVPAGFSVPSAGASAPGATTTDCVNGNVTVSGSTIQVTGFTLLDASSCTITYGDRSGGGPGATATAVGGYTAYNFATEERSSSTGTLASLASGSPLMLVTAADGSGTTQSSPASTVTGSTGNYLTFTFVGPEGGIDDGSVAVIVPDGWTTPNPDDTQPGGLGGTCGAAAGYTVTPVAGGEEVQTGNVYMFGGQQCTIEYGVNGSDSGVTAPTAAGSYVFTALEASTVTGTLTELANSPSIDVGSGGAGTMTVSPNTALAGSSGNTLRFTYTASAALSDGTVAVTVPQGWSNPSASASAAGATTTTCPGGAVGISGMTIDVTGVNLASGSCTITYGDTSGGPGARAPSSGGGGEPYTFTAQEQSTSADTLTRLSSGSPQVTVTAGDGAGTIAVSPPSATPDSTGNELTFTYSSPAGGLDDGALSIAVPDGWSAPQTGSANTSGYVTSNCGTATIAGSTINLSGVTLDDGAECAITYGSGAGASAPSAIGPTTFTAEEASTSAGTLTQVQGQPVVNVSQDGTGSLGVTPQTASAASTGNTLTFTYDAAAPLNAGELTIVVPFGWSLPSTVASAPGYTTTTCQSATLTIAANVIELTQFTLGNSGDCTITYGATSQGGPGASASSTPGTATFTTEEMSSGSGTLTALASSPVTHVYALDGAGQLTIPTQFVTAGSTGITFAFTYTAAVGGLNDGQINVAVPPEWAAPSTTVTDAGYSTSTCGTVGGSGQTIEVSGVTLSGGDTCTITYGDQSGGGPGATAPTPPGRYAFTAQDASSQHGTLAGLESSPGVDIPSPDGVGTVSVGPASVTAGSSGDSLAFSYVAAAGGIDDGGLTLTVPTGWTPPSSTATAAGAVTATCGTVTVSGMSIELIDVSIGGGKGCTIVYGSKTGGGPGATAPQTVGSSTFTAGEMSTAAGRLTPLRAFPTVDLARPGSKTSPGGGPPPPPPSSGKCVVPNLKGVSLSKAKRMLRSAHCAIGKVSKPKARKHHKLDKLVVSKTTPGAAAKVAAGAKIGLKLRPAPKPKRRRRHHLRAG
jgi:hypothetical protein